MIGHIRNELGERTDLIEKCTPFYPPFGKRILLDNGWYQAIKQPQAELVTENIVEITPAGVRTEDGVERPADVIVYATGFNMSAMASRLNVHGRGGINLAEVWADENPRAYLGIAVPGFPNFFMMGGPNSGLGHGGSTIFQAESQARYISSLLVRMVENNIVAVDVKQERFEQFVNKVDQEHEQLIWTHPGLSTYYRNKHGRVFSVMPFRLVDYWDMTRDASLADYNVEEHVL
jgi:4-hydroxyacetophenone monooxygenase